jgi:HD-GYP domain-containing protein (c-di-GMP phosphodiesterase class II)
MDVEVDLRQLVYALSDALDLVGVNDFYHGKRVGLMAVEVARTLGTDSVGREELFDTGLLHDCGVSSTKVHQHLVEEMDWSGSQGHCERGYGLLEGLPQLAHLAPAVLYHHTHWQDFARMDLAADVALKANLIFLVDRADALAAPHYGPDLLRYKEDIRNNLARLSGTLFSPVLVDAFMTASHADAFWLVLEPRHIQNFLGEMLQAGRRRKLSFPELRRMAMLFAYVVDAKSPFTAAHSLGVARLARLLGELDGQDEETCDKLELAGLMHDLGKLQVPDAILEKPGPLNETERSVMHRHSFETYQILRRIPGLEDVAAWAAFHHETLDGAGYPYNLTGQGLPRPARLVAVADVFQALAQDRPYRASVPPLRILDLLCQMVREGKLDAGAVDLVGRHLDACWRAASEGQSATAAP